MEEWIRIRQRVLREGVSKRQILRETGMHWTTLEKILKYPSPPGYCRTKPPKKSKIGPLCLLKIPSLPIYKVIVPVPHDFLDEFEKIDSTLGRRQK